MAWVIKKLHAVCQLLWEADNYHRNEVVVSQAEQLSTVCFAEVPNALYAEMCVHSRWSERTTW
jgi:hypothetical protein